MQTILFDLRRLEDLTRRYADYGGRKAGLVGVLGGLLLALSTGLGTGWGLGMLLRQRTGTGPWPAFWSPFFHQSGVLPFWITLIAWASPFIFLAGGAVLRRRIYQGLGQVKAIDPDHPRPQPRPVVLWSGLAALMGTLLVGFWLGWFRDQETLFLRITGEVLLGAAFVALMRARRPRGDELTLAILLWLSAGLATSTPTGPWALCSLLFWVFGMGLLVRGAIQHQAFLNLRRELHSLQSAEPS
jgi:hypothetical protein